MQKHVRLLVVNERESYCQHFKEHADDNNFDYEIECQCVQSGEEAMQTLNKWTPDLVLLDMFLPDMNGFQFLEYCNEIHMPVVATTEEQLNQVGRGALSRGAMDYIKTDDDPEEIDYVLEKVVSLSSECQIATWC